MVWVQWTVAAITAIFVAWIAYLQWRTAQQKAVLALFDRRYEIYKAVDSCVGQMCRNSQAFDSQQQSEFVKAMAQAYFFFDDDIHAYLAGLWKDIVAVLAAESVEPPNPNRMQSMVRINDFYTTGRPLFARYMRFTQTVPNRVGRWW